MGVDPDQFHKVCRGKIVKLNLIVQGLREKVKV